MKQGAHAVSHNEKFCDRGPVMEYEWYIEYGGMVPKGENQEKELPSEAVPPKEAAPFLSCP